MKKTLIIQIQKPPSIRWISLTTYSENLEGAKEEIKEYKGWNQDCIFRVIERETIITDSVIYLPD